jgi:hypothetical protein
VALTMSPDQTVSWKEYVDTRFSDFERRITERFDASDDAVTKAERTMNERLNGMNEFRDALKDQSSRMATRVELDKTDADVGSLRDVLGRMATRDEMGKVEEAVHDLRRHKANMDGRLLVVTGIISIGVSLGVWALSKVGGP